MIDTIILVPVLDRVQNIERLMESVIKTSRYAKVLFLASPGKKYFIEHCALQAASIKYDGYCEYVVVDWECGIGDYAKKINYGISITSETYIFLGADDIVFKPGWRKSCLSASTLVVGTNDLGNPRVISGSHSTHFFVNRDYVNQGLIDGRPGLLFEGYHHEYVDDEFIATARKRNCYSFAPNALVEHLHPSWNKAPMDEVYSGQQDRMRRSRNLFLSRSRLWEN